MPSLRGPVTGLCGCSLASAVDDDAPRVTPADSSIAARAFRTSGTVVLGDPSSIRRLNLGISGVGTESMVTMERSSARQSPPPRANSAETGIGKVDAFGEGAVTAVAGADMGLLGQGAIFQRFCAG